MMLRSRSLARIRKHRGWASVALAVAAVPLPATGADRYWVGGNYYWDVPGDPARWSTTLGGAGGASVPVNGDNVIFSSALNLTVQRDSASGTYTSPGVNVIYLSNTGSNLTMLQFLTGAISMFANQEQVGVTGRGMIDHQAGSNSMTDLFMGVNASSTGTYALAGSATLNISGTESIGFSGTGVFNQTGGTHTITGSELRLAAFAGANGTLNLSGGTLTTPSAYVGGYSGAAGGTGTLNVTGGAMTVSGTLKSWNAASIIRLDGGTLSAGSLVLPDWNNLIFGSGVLNLTGGTSSNTGSLSIARTGGATGTANLSAGSLYTQFTVVGDVSNGIFNQSGGTHVLSVDLSLGFSPSGVGTYNMSGGSVNTSTVYLGGSSLGAGGVGTLNLTGGVMTVSNMIRSFNASSKINLNGGTLSVGYMNLTDWSRLNFQKGTLNIVSGLNNSNAGDLLIGTATGTSTLNLSGGVLGVPIQDLGLIAGNNTTFNHTGGTNTVDFLEVAAVAGSTATYALSGSGTLNGFYEWVGYNGTGALNQSGGTNTVGGHLAVGYGSGASGTMSLSGGKLTVPNVYIGGTDSAATGGTGRVSVSGGTMTVSGTIKGWGNATIEVSGTGVLTTVNEIVGYDGSGVLNQSGGSHTISGTLFAGMATGGTGAVNLSGGTLSAANVFLGGDASNFGGVGTLNITGGAMTVPGTIQTYFDASTITLNGGTLSAGAFSLGGNWSRFTFRNGTLNLTGGSSIAGNVLSIGSGTGLSTVNLSAGLLLAGSIEALGSGGGTVVFNQTGGTHSGDTLSLGTGGTVTYNLSAGSLSISHEFVGYGGTTVLNQTGGTNTPNHFFVGHYGSSALSTFNLSDGTLNASVYEWIGDDSTGIVNQTGGTNTTPLLIVGHHGGGTYNLSAGALTVDSEIVGNYLGVFNQMGGTHTVTSASGLQLAPSGGTGTVNLSAGTLVTPNAYLGLVNQFQPGQGFLNITGGTMTVAGQVQALDTFSTITLGGGTLSAGSLSLPSWNQLVMNSGTLNLTGGISVNTGSLSVGVSTAAARVNLTAGTLSAPNVFLGGNSSADAGGAGTVNLTGGVMTVTGTVKSWNATSGITVNGGTLVVNAMTMANWSSLALTTGTLSLTGGSSTGPGTLTVGASATLNGYGALAAGSLSNSGALTAKTGNLILTATTLTNSGTLSNAAGASLFVQTNSVVNTGNIAVNAGGTVSFNSAVTIPAGKTLTLTGGVLAGTTITNSGTITGSGQILANLVNQATATFNGPTQLYGTLSNSAAGLITVRNNQLLVTGAAVNSGTIRAVSGGTLAFDGGLTGNGVLPADIPGQPLAAAAPQAGAVVVDPGGALITNYARQASIALSGNAGDPTSYAKLSIRKKIDGGDTSVTNALNIQTDLGGNPLGRFDLADNALIVDYSGASPITSIRALITSSRAGGTWAGSGGITSSVAATDASKAVGYAEASAALGASGGTFAGQTADATAVLVRYTIKGDANLDGTVGFADLVAVAQHYDTFATGQWFTGDFDYDGNIGFSDLVAVAQNYDSVLPSSPLPGATSDFNTDLAAAFASVPEPSSAFLTLLAACGLAARRRRRG